MLSPIHQIELVNILRWLNVESVTCILWLTLVKYDVTLGSFSRKTKHKNSITYQTYLLSLTLLNYDKSVVSYLVSILTYPFDKRYSLYLVKHLSNCHGPLAVNARVDVSWPLELSKQCWRHNLKDSCYMISKYFSCIVLLFTAVFQHRRRILWFSRCYPLHAQQPGN